MRRDRGMAWASRWTGSTKGSTAKWAGIMMMMISTMMSAKMIMMAFIMERRRKRKMSSRKRFFSFRKLKCVIRRLRGRGD